jgi:hypothetical protein
VITREPENMFHESIVVNRDSVSDIASSDDREEREDEDDEEAEQGHQSEDEEHGCAMGTITPTVPQCMERSRQMR